MKLIKTEDAVGCILCHDMTQIIKGVTKDAIFRKGHIITEEDIPVLLSIGKDNIYIYENNGNMMHENDAAKVLVSLCKSEYMSESDVKEGKIELIAEKDGLLKVDKNKLFAVNSFGQMMIATRHGNTMVKKGDKLAGTRIIPLVIEKEKMSEIKSKVGEGTILKLMPFKHKKIALLTTGNEVYYNRIKDTFSETVLQKLDEFDIQITNHVILPDNNELITNTISEELKNGADIVICTGGMSVDPDDKTPLAIKNTGAEIISYGSPVLPGAMFMIAYMNNKVIMGLPGCVMYSKRTIFDLILPRVMADDKITSDELSALGEGGLCLGCNICTFPNCGFGKGW